ncbi:unnamed protein product [Paramecium pentaurelia]|uniref:MORN repeat protein n=1 Tax=Paramecium pentaurelia TaxID=43138 RepID=A0A8S1XGQ2_9CILI|nr:unnamed protein product [Paramecium pentaurelia]CAD8200155.1 unnamed protein product [Paramecium pentaurelia]
MKQKIGGGEYNSDGVKIGEWIEQSDKFKYGNQSTWRGQYDQQGVKVGTWEIYFRELGDEKPNIKIGGGEYDEQVRKIGKWVEQKDGFYYSNSMNNKYIFIGEYKDGVKQGQWKDNKLK